MNNSSLHELTQNSLSSSELAQPLREGILGDFRLNNSLFLIVLGDRSLENFPQLDSTISKEAAYYSVVGRIKVDGESYLIVKANDDRKYAEPSLSELLTERELQIAAFVALGWSNKQIAKRLQISEWTVSTHLRRIFVKLDVDTRAAMVYCCASLIHVVLKQISEHTALCKRKNELGFLG